MIYNAKSLRYQQEMFKLSYTDAWWKIYSDSGMYIKLETIINHKFHSQTWQKHIMLKHEFEISIKLFVIASKVHFFSSWLGFKVKLLSIC